MFSPSSHEISCAPGTAADHDRAMLTSPAKSDDEDLDVALDLDVPPAVDEGPRDRTEGPGGEPDHHDDLLADDEPSGLDAAVADDLPVGDPDLVEDDGVDGGDDEAPPVSISGDDDLAHFEEASADDAGTGIVDDEPHVDEDLRSSTDDGGVEGTSEDIAAEVDEAALPELDADDGGTFELDDLMKELRASGLGHEPGAEGLALVDAWSVRGPFSAVAASGGAVVAVGSELCVLAPSATSVRRHALPREGTAVTPLSEGAVVGTARGVLLVMGVSSSTPGILSLLETSRAVSALATFAGRTWALVGDELWQVGSPPSPPISVRGGVRRLVEAANALLTVEGGRIRRFRGDDGGWEALPLPAHLAERLDADDLVCATATDAAVAVASPSSITIARADAVQTIDVDDLVAATFAGDDDAAPLLVLHRVRDGLAVLSVDPRGRTSLEAKLALELSAREPVGVAWDDTREALFIATAAGLFALAKSRAH
jgi:hypothetical protein